MAVVSVKINQEEEKKSSIIKRSLTEMYEDIVDKNIIDKFEKEKHTFVNAEDILKEIL